MFFIIALVKTKQLFKMKALVIILIGLMHFLPFSCFTKTNIVGNYPFSNGDPKRYRGDELLVLDLIEFKIQKTVTGNCIKWTMFAEINNDFFSVERTTDGVNYLELAQINGAGNTTEVHDYSFEDRNSKQVINYYRIKMTDFDGNVHYSELLSVDNRNQIDKEISVKLSLEGKEVNDEYKGMIIIRYSDGTSKKIIQ